LIMVGLVKHSLLFSGVTAEWDLFLFLHILGNLS